MGRVSPIGALLFSLSLSVISVFYFAVFAGPLASVLALGTILFYAVVYTLWLKPRTPYNIVIGGAAGAAAPLIACAALTGTLSPLAWVLFMIVFLWTPPHFWALSLHFKEDYAGVGIPMLPLVKGDAATRRQIFWYSLVLVPTTLVQVFMGISGWLYGISALVLGVLFVKKTAQLLREEDNASAYRFFLFSIVYLFTLFVAMIVDHFLFVRVF